jgi:hypothetical protein
VVCYPVQAEASRWADPPSKETYQNVCKIHTFIINSKVLIGDKLR